MRMNYILERWLLFALGLLFFASCSKEVTSQRIITKSNIDKIINKDLNLVFLTTDWCPASRYILKENYTKICDSLENRINVVIICASESDSSFNNYLAELGIKCSYYLLPNKSSHEKILEHNDRKRIRHFIKNNLLGYKTLDLPWQFSVPVSLFVNKDLQVVSEAPQGYDDIKKYIDDNLEINN